MVSQKEFAGQHTTSIPNSLSKKVDHSSTCDRTGVWRCESSIDMKILKLQYIRERFAKLVSHNLQIYHSCI
jgi:hypothetical protein